MNWAIFLAAAVVLTFSFVIAFGAPFLPTLKVRTADALELLDLKSGQTLVELGSGDGRILRAAAERGIYAIGYELNPLLVIWSKLRNWRLRHFITVHWKNYWRHKLPVTDGVYVFLLNPYMEKLDKKIEQDMQSWPAEVSDPAVRAHLTQRTASLRDSDHPGNTRKPAYNVKLKLVSFAFTIPGKKPVRQNNGMMLYHYSPHSDHDAPVLS